jgi:hypothetical protein
MKDQFICFPNGNKYDVANLFDQCPQRWEVQQYSLFIMFLVSNFFLLLFGLSVSWNNKTELIQVQIGQKFVSISLK